MAKQTIMVVLLCALSACASVETSFYQRPDYDWTELATYAWTDSIADRVGPGVVVSDLVDASLADKGYRVSREPDFFVHPSLSLEGTLQTGTATWDASGPHRTQRATITLEAREVGTQAVLWRGRAELREPADLTPAQIDAVVRDAVLTLLAEFPAAPGAAQGGTP